MRRKRCPWCASTAAEEWSEDLCRGHQAEYEGTTIAELDRMEREQYAEWYDAYHG
jgi:hypothetical protein